VRGLKVLALWCLCLCAFPRTAAAEWHFTPLLGFTFGANTTILDPEHGTGQKHPIFGGAVSLLGKGIVGAEGIFVVTPGFFQNNGDATDSTGTPFPTGLIESSRVTAVMGNVVLTTPRRLTEYFLRPYVSGGLGVLRVSKEENARLDIFPLQANLAGFDIGGGAVGFFSQRTGVRFDFRYYSTLHDTDRGPGVTLGGDVHLRYFAASVGFVIRR
jgi:hypothetical protein